MKKHSKIVAIQGDSLNSINIMKLSMENELIEKIANLLDDYLETEIEDLSNIDKMVQLEKKEARLQQLLQNNSDEINGGSK